MAVILVTAACIRRRCSSSGTGTAWLASISGMPSSIRYRRRNRGLYSTASPAK